MIHQAFAYPEYGVQPLQEAWGDVIDIRQEQRDEWQQMGWGAGPNWSTGRVDDRQAGKLRPIFETEQDLDDIRAISRVIADSTTPGISALLNLTNYVIGKGFAYKAAPVKGMADKQSVAEVQAVIDEFIERNRWAMHRERELFRVSRRDGEYLLGLWDSDGYTTVRTIDVARIREPRELPDFGRSWSFGVDTEADDLETIHGYHILWDGLTGELDYLPADQAQHFRLNVDSGVKRGVTDFFPVNGDIDRIRKMLRNMVHGGSVQAAIAIICEHAAGVTGAQVEQLVQTHGTMSRQVQTHTGGSRTRYVTDERGGTRLDVGKGQTYKGSPLANGEAASAFVSIVQAGLRSIGSRWAMPEYMISGDASNANYNSTKEAGTPFVKNAEFEQAVYCDQYRRVMWMAVKNACAAGRIGKSYEDVRRLVEIQVEPQAVVIRDPDKETARRAILKDKGILSDRTWAAQEGLDYDEQIANGAKAVTLPSMTGMPVDGPKPAQGVADVQDMGLNGAQIDSLLSLVQQAAAKQLPIETIRATIQAAFPLLSTEKLDGILSPLAGFTPPVPFPVQEADDDTSGIKAAKNAVAQALKDGTLKKTPCKCGAADVEAHHDNYRKPLEVTWLCRACHDKAHGKTLREVLESVAAWRGYP